MKKKALIIGGSGGLSGRLATMAQKEYDVWVLTRGKRPVPEGVQRLTADRNDSAAFLHALLGEGCHSLPHTGLPDASSAHRSVSVKSPSPAMWKHIRNTRDTFVTGFMT